MANTATERAATAAPNYAAMLLAAIIGSAPIIALAAFAGGQ